MQYELDENYVRTAIDRVGGPTKASNLLGVSNNTINVWMNNRHIPNIDYAKKLAELSEMKVQELRGTR